MMIDRAEDLSARARRLDLDEQELKELERCLEASFEARLMHQAGCAFDQEDSVLPGDEELSARIAERVLSEWNEMPRKPARRRVGVRVFAVVAATTLAAAAAIPSIQRIGSTPEVRVVANPFSLPGEVLRRAKQLSDSSLMGSRPEQMLSLERSSEESSERESRQEERGERVRSKPRTLAQPGSNLPHNSAELFAAANLSRRQGDTVNAIRQYRALQREYPESAEARAADIALGVLLLNSSSAASLGHFRNYLRRHPNGELALEALWGEARALSRLGRRAQAAKSWRAIVRRYPDSAYARAARSYLDDAEQSR